MKSKVTHIAAGIILSSDAQHVFITHRATSSHCGGFWEFAGGKIEQGETEEQAVKRELNEEVGISVLACEPFITVTHEYPSKTLTLHFFLITAFEGEPYGREQQEGKWVSLSELVEFEFPEANSPVLEKLKAHMQKNGIECQHTQCISD